MTEPKEQDLPSTQVQSGQVLDIKKRFPSDRFNRLTPTDTIMEISPFQRVTLEVVTISTNPYDGDIYKISSNKIKGNWVDNYALSKSALDRITHALGISWISSETRRIDDRSDPNRVEFKAVGVFKQTDGTTTTVDGYKEIDLIAIEEELLMNYQEKAMNGKLKFNNKVLKWGTTECEDRIAHLTKKAMLSRRKFKVPLAESGAKDRAVRSMGLKAHYTLNELQKPFIVPRVQFDPSRIMNDPEMKRALVENAMASARQLYGESSPAFHSTDNGDPKPPSKESSVTIEGESEDIPSDPNTATVAAEDAAGQETPEEKDSLSDKQRKAIFAQARKFWGDDSDDKLHKQIKKHFDAKVESVNDLTVDQASELIAALNKAVANAPAPSASKSAEVELEVKDLLRAATKGWNVSQPSAVERLNEISGKRYRVRNLDNLTPKQIGLMIGRIEDGQDVFEEQPPVEPEPVDDDLPF